MGIDCRLDLGRGSDVAGSGERMQRLVGSRCLHWPMMRAGEWNVCLGFSSGWLVWQRCSRRLVRPSMCGTVGS